MPPASCTWMCTVHTLLRQVFNFRRAAELVAIITVHLTGCCKCRISFPRTWCRDIKRLLKLLKSYIHPATAIKWNFLLLVLFLHSTGSRFHCGTIGCLSIELSQKENFITFAVPPEPCSKFLFQELCSYNLTWMTLRYRTAMYSVEKTPWLLFQPLL